MFFSSSSIINRGCVSENSIRSALARNGVYEFGHEKEDICLLINLNPKGFYYLNKNEHWINFCVNSRLNAKIHKRKHNDLSQAFMSCNVPYVIVTTFTDLAIANTTEILFQRNSKIVFDPIDEPIVSTPFVLHSDNGNPVWAAIEKLADKYEFVCSLSRKTKKEIVGTMACTLPTNIFKSSNLGTHIRNSVNCPMSGLSAVICENDNKTTTIELRVSS